MKLKINPTKIIKPLNKADNTHELNNIELAEPDQVDSKLELLKYTSQVQSRIKKDISSDFTLAKLTEKDKEFIIESTSTAYFTKKIIEMHKRKLMWDWNDQQKIWIQRKMNKQEQDQIQNCANTTFDAYMNRIYMIVITNRNVDQNHLLKYLSGLGDDGKPLENQEELTVAKKLKKLIQPEQEENE